MRLPGKKKSIVIHLVHHIVPVGVPLSGNTQEIEFKITSKINKIQSTNPCMWFDEIRTNRNKMKYKKVLELDTKVIKKCIKCLKEGNV